MNKRRPMCLIRIVDDDAGVRDSYRYLIESDGWIVRTYQDAEDFLANDNFDIPGCAVLDVRMPGLSGLELQTYLKKISSTLPIIFVSAHGDIEMAVRAIRNGALDFLAKPVDDEKLLDAIERAAQSSLTSDEQTKAVLKLQERWQSLSPREKEVAQWVGQGLMNKVIADKMGIAERTVQVHRANACQKLGVRNAVDISKAIEKLDLV